MGPKITAPFAVPNPCVVIYSTNIYRALSPPGTILGTWDASGNMVGSEPWCVLAGDKRRRSGCIRGIGPSVRRCYNVSKPVFRIGLIRKVAFEQT